MPDLPIVYRVFAHHDCIHNQIVSVHNRVCGRVPVASPAALKRLDRFMQRLAKSLPKVVPWDLDRVVNSYKGNKRVNYGDAAHEYRSHGLGQDQARVKMFIKNEKIRFKEKGDKQNPDPRAIQYRDPVFAVVFAQYIKAIEEVVYQLKGNRCNRLPPGRVFGKGMTSVQKGKLLREKRERFKKPVVLPLDASRFDQHLDVGHLRALHRFYNALCHDPYLNRLCSWTIVNNVTTSRGLRYTAVGGRMSGDMDTSLGACLWMLCMLALFFEESTVQWDCLDDGDDILLIIERDDLAWVMREMPNHFLELGQEIKIEDPCYEIEDVEWCQAKPVFVGGEYKFVRNPAKVLSGALVGPKFIQMRSEASRRALTNTIGLGEGHLNLGVPVLQSFAKCLVRNANTTRQIKLEYNSSLMFKVRHEIGKTYAKKLPDFTPRPVSDESRLSFARAFGITITEQLSYEEYFDNWQINFDDYTPQLDPVAVPTWTWMEYDLERY